MTMSTVASSRWWQGFHAVAAYALSIIAAVAARGKLNDALANMHPPGQGWESYATISAPSTLWARRGLSGLWALNREYRPG